MFNKSFNLTQFVKDIPSLPIRKAAWLSLVGSVNAALVGAADAIARRLEAEGLSPEDFKKLTRREVIAMCAGPETGASKSIIATNSVLYHLHLEWRSELLHSSIVSTGRKADDTLGSISSTIAMMTGPQKERDINKDAVPILASLGIVVTTDMIAAAKRQRLADDNHFANLRAQRAGMVEYIIDNVFASDKTSFDGEIDENYSRLDNDVKEYLCNKLAACLNKALATCVNNTLFGRSGDSVLGVCDYPIAQRLHAELSAAMTSATTKVIEHAQAHKAPAPTQPASVTEVLPNGIRLTRAATAA